MFSLLDSILLYLIPLVSSLVSWAWLNCRRNTFKHGCVRPIKNACKIMQTWSNVERQVAKWQSGWTFKQFVCKCVRLCHWANFPTPSPTFEFHARGMLRFWAWPKLRGSEQPNRSGTTAPMTTTPFTLSQRETLKRNANAEFRVEVFDSIGTDCRVQHFVFCV